MGIGAYNVAKGLMNKLSGQNWDGSLAQVSNSGAQRMDMPLDQAGETALESTQGAMNSFNDPTYAAANGMTSRTMGSDMVSELGADAYSQFAPNESQASAAMGGEIAAMMGQMGGLEGMANAYLDNPTVINNGRAMAKALGYNVG
jgi:hypothetical protein